MVIRVPLSDIIAIEAANIWYKIFLSRTLFILDCTGDLIFHQCLDLDETMRFNSLQNFEICLGTKGTADLKWPKKWVHVLLLQALVTPILNQL